jgi:hypothetical protein
MKTNDAASWRSVTEAFARVLRAMTLFSLMAGLQLECRAFALVATGGRT